MISYISRLVELKKCSMRRGIWYKVLNTLERAQVDLTVRLVKNLRSPLLARVLDVIIQKLSEALQSRVSRMVKSVGFPQAAKLSGIAQSWGNKSAETWIRDPKFAKFLAVMSLNSFQKFESACV